MKRIFLCFFHFLPWENGNLLAIIADAFRCAGNVCITECNDGAVPGKEILFVEMNGFHKSFHSLRIAGVFTYVFA